MQDLNVPNGKALLRDRAHVGCFLEMLTKTGSTSRPWTEQHLCLSISPVHLRPVTKPNRAFSETLTKFAWIPSTWVRYGSLQSGEYQRNVDKVVPTWSAAVSHPDVCAPFGVDLGVTEDSRMMTFRLSSLASLCCDWK